MTHTLTVLDDGPLKLESDGSILHADGKALGTDEKTTLCRCGLSDNKPFCDGSHRKAGFSGARDISEEKIQQYPGKSVSVRFNRSICSGAQRCVDNLPSVFKTDDSENWIFPDNDSVDRVVAAVKSCPSGALSHSLAEHALDDEGHEPSPRIEVLKNGPYVVQDVELVDAPAATGFRSSAYALCRCGKSGNKPYCDYSHAQEGWTDD